MRPIETRRGHRVGAICTAVAGLAVAATALAGTPAEGDLLIATRSTDPPSAIVQANALGGQTLVTTFPVAGEYATSLVQRADGQVYATVDNALSDADSIVRIDPATGDRVTIVDQTTAAGQLSSPTGIDIDPATGDVIFVQGAQVMRADPGTGTVSVVSEGGRLADVREIVVDAAGTFAYVVDAAAHSVVRVALADGTQKLVVARRPGAAVTIFEPRDLVLDGASIVDVAQTAALTRFRLSDAKSEDVVRDGGAGTVDVGDPTGIDIDTAGNFVVVDEGTNRALRIGADGRGTVITTGGLIVSPQDVIVVGGATQSTGGDIGGGDSCVLCGLATLASGRAKVKVAKVGRRKADMGFDIVFHVTAPTWSATVDGRRLTGTYETTNAKGRKAVLTPDAASVAALLELVGDRLGAPAPQPVLLLSAAPKLVLKVNKKRTKAVLKIVVKVETDIGIKTDLVVKTRKGALKAKLRGRIAGS